LVAALWISKESSRVHVGSGRGTKASHHADDIQSGAGGGERTSGGERRFIHRSSVASSTSARLVVAGEASNVVGSHSWPSQSPPAGWLRSRATPKQRVVP